MRLSNRILTIMLATTALLCSCSKQEIKKEEVPNIAAFKDEKFREMIAKTLNKSTEDLTYKDLDNIVGLDVYYYAERIENTTQYKDVCSVTLKKDGFQEVFDIYYNTPQEDRAELESPQDYSHNEQIDEFNGLEDIKLLKNLKTLSLNSEYILMEEDPVKYFSGNKALEKISLYNYVVEDLEEIGTLTELNTLGIGINLRNIPDGVEINYIDDLTPLKNLKKLNSLSLSGNFISDLSPISDMDSITDLSITNAALGDISPVAKMKNLTSVSFYYNGIEDVTPLTMLPNLEYIHLDYNYIQDLTPFEKLNPNVVKYVSVDMNGFSDDTPLKHLGKEKVNLGYEPYWELE